MFKKFLSLGVLTVMMFSMFACDNTPADTTGVTETSPGTTAVDSGTSADTEPAETEDAVYYEPSDRAPLTLDSLDFSSTDWSDTITNAAAQANAVQARYADAGRNAFTFENNNAVFTYELTADGRKLISSIKNKDGAAYVSDSCGAFVKDADGKSFLSSASNTAARMNSARLGYYYYDVKFRMQDFINPDASLSVGTDKFDILAAVGSAWSKNDTSKVERNRDTGEISYTVESIYDPYIACAKSFYNTADYNTIEITMTTEKSTSCTFYLVAGSQSGFNSSQNITFSVTPGVSKTYTVGLASVGDYTGTLRGFRIDCGDTAGEKITISSIKAVNMSGISVPVKYETIFHTYSDKVHEQIRFLAVSDTEGLASYGETINIAADTVAKLIIKDKNGEHTSLEGIDNESVEYAAFDIKGAGIFGIIMPNTEDNGVLRVTKADGYYVLTHTLETSKQLKAGNSYILGHRIYTDSGHLFNPFRKEAYIERNPLTDIFITVASDDSKALGYNPLSGAYEFSLVGTDFSTAYYKIPDKHFKVNAALSGDGVTDRTVYIKTATTAGCLEGGALLDENSSLLPIPVQVGKNFCGEYEEPLYDPEDASYGEVFFPITLKADEAKAFTVLNLYQNWGKTPLKQLSSIAFHISYYHLSVGATETNCIAPYFVYGKDGWTLPDFRALSSPLWAGQPQHTSAGRLYFLQYTDSDGKYYQSESQSANISSSGPVYADIDMSYLSDDGKITAEYRHLELPQTDETRTYYQIKLTVNSDIEIENFARDFSFFTFDGRAVLYKKLGYLDENNEYQIKDATADSAFTEYIKLGSQSPYYDYYGAGSGDTVNFALIVKDSDITIGGQKYGGAFVLKNTYDGSLNNGSLTLDLGKTTLKAGDVIEINLLLLPWGSTSSTSDRNVKVVRSDSCLDPYVIEASVGQATADEYLPKVMATDNVARFTISGGANNAVVRVYGLTSYKKPAIYEIVNGEKVEYVVCSSNGYDGYQVYREADGTYSVSFAVNLGTRGAAREFIVEGTDK